MDLTRADSLTLDELLRLNPHLSREEIERMLEHLSDAPASPRKRRSIMPDRLRVGDPSRAKKSGCATPYSNPHPDRPS